MVDAYIERPVDTIYDMHSLIRSVNGKMKALVGRLTDIRNELKTYVKTTPLNETFQEAHYGILTQHANQIHIYIRRYYQCVYKYGLRIDKLKNKLDANDKIYGCYSQESKLKEDISTAYEYMEQAVKLSVEIDGAYNKYKLGLITYREPK